MGLEMLKSCLSFRFDLIFGISFSHKCLQCPMDHGVLWMPLATPCPERLSGPCERLPGRVAQHIPARLLQYIADTSHNVKS